MKALTWKNIEDGFIKFTQRKTGEPERLPLNVTAKGILEGRKGKIIDPAGKIFAMGGDHHKINLTLREWAKIARVEKHLTFHVGRHSYAFMLLTAGVGLYDTSKALGHKTVRMTESYAHLVPEELKKKIDEKLPVFDIGGAK